MKTYKITNSNGMFHAVINQRVNTGIEIIDEYFVSKWFRNIGIWRYQM